MTTLGVFRDDFYNAISVLPNSQSNASTQAGGTILASSLGGAADCYVALSGQTTAQTYTTDTAANIISYIQNCLPSLVPGNSGDGPGVPNLYGVVWTISINNQNTSSGTMTINGGTGVTIASVAGLATSAVAINTNTIWVLKITGVNTVTMTRVA